MRSHYHNYSCHKLSATFLCSRHAFCRNLSATLLFQSPSLFPQVYRYTSVIVAIPVATNLSATFLFTVAVLPSSPTPCCHSLSSALHGILCIFCTTYGGSLHLFILLFLSEESVQGAAGPRFEPGTQLTEVAIGRALNNSSPQLTLATPLISNLSTFYLRYPSYHPFISPLSSYFPYYYFTITGIFKQSIVARNRTGIRLSYKTARLHSLAE